MSWFALPLINHWVNARISLATHASFKVKFKFRKYHELSLSVLLFFSSFYWYCRVFFPAIEEYELRIKSHIVLLCFKQPYMADDISHFVEQVKGEFSDQPDVYNTFVDIIKRYGSPT